LSINISRIEEKVFDDLNNSLGVKRVLGLKFTLLYFHGMTIAITSDKHHGGGAPAALECSSREDKDCKS